MAVWKIHANFITYFLLHLPEFCFYSLSLCHFTCFRANTRLTAISNQDLSEQTCLVYARTADTLEVDAEAAGQKLVLSSDFEFCFEFCYKYEMIFALHQAK